MIKIYTDINQVKKSGKELIESPYDKCSLIEAEYIKEFGINSLYKIHKVYTLYMNAKYSLI